MVLTVISLSAPQQTLICMAGIFGIADHINLYGCDCVQEI